MSLRCKKGDLAIALRPAVAGLVVEVRDFIGGAISDCGRPLNNAWFVTWRDDGGVAESGSPFAECDNELLPIRPGDLKETEEAEKEVESVG